MLIHEPHEILFKLHQDPNFSPLSDFWIFLGEIDKCIHLSKKNTDCHLFMTR